MVPTEMLTAERRDWVIRNVLNNPNANLSQNSRGKLAKSLAVVARTIDDQERSFRRHVVDGGDSNSFNRSPGRSASGHDRDRAMMGHDFERSLGSSIAAQSRMDAIQQPISAQMLAPVVAGGSRSSWNESRMSPVHSSSSNAHHFHNVVVAQDLMPQDLMPQPRDVSTPQIPVERNRFTDLMVAILPKDYPRVLLNPAELRNVEESIMDEVCRGWDVKLKFNGIQYRSGLLIVDCLDRDTLEWLRYNVDKLSSWRGVHLDTRIGSDIPDPLLIRMVLPQSSGQDADKSLALIDAQNEGLSLKYWTVFSRSEEDGNQILTMAIDVMSMETIAKERFMLHYKFGQVEVFTESRQWRK